MGFFSEDSLDIGIIGQVNQLTKRTGYHFVICGPADPAVCFIVLTKKEIEKLLTQRRWKFP